ncbi:MAG: DUF3810 domain-containing protein [Bacteroidia bacterium]|nr:DUF3810 domain-containing protein [Bacteroidia bacterium]
MAGWRPLQNLPRRTRRRLFWLSLGLFALGLRQIFGEFPALTEKIYSRGIFCGVRYLLDFSVGFLPFPLVYLLLAVLLFLLAKGILKWKRNPEKLVFKTRLQRFFLDLGAWLGGIVFFFMVLWGFNYERVPVEAKLDFKPVPLDSAALYQAVEVLQAEMIAARQQITQDTAALSADFMPENLELEMRTHLSGFLQSQNYPVPGRVRAWKIWPGGALMRFGIAGIYIPFTGQGHLPIDMPSFDQPFTMAHEMSHAYGFGDEGTANFLAFMACEFSQKPILQYSGRLNYWGYLISEFYQTAPTTAQKISESLPAGIQADRRILRNYSRQYRSFLSGWGRSVNNAYLKTQGVEGGILSYNRMVVLVEAWRKKP